MYGQGAKSNFSFGFTWLTTRINFVPGVYERREGRCYGMTEIRSLCVRSSLSESLWDQKSGDAHEIIDMSIVNAGTVIAAHILACIVQEVHMIRTLFVFTLP